MAQFFDYDPLTGISTYTEPGDKPGEVKVYRQADVAPIAEYARKQANEKVRDRKRGEESWSHYAYVPQIALLQMHKAGINVLKDTKGVIEFMNKHYPYCRTTDKWHDNKTAIKRRKR